MSMRCEFEGMNMVCSGGAYYGRMGLGSYIGRNTHLNADIGRFTSIAPGVRCVNATHPMKEPFVTTSPLFFSRDRSKNPQRETFAKRQMVEEFRYYDKDREIDVYIGNDCWIGQDVTFIGGIKVDDGAVVLAKAVVTKDVPPYSIVCGTPGRVTGMRFDQDIIDELLRIEWWNWPLDVLKKHARILLDPMNRETLAKLTAIYDQEIR